LQLQQRLTIYEFGKAKVGLNCFTGAREARDEHFLLNPWL